MNENEEQKENEDRLFNSLKHSKDTNTNDEKVGQFAGERHSDDDEKFVHDKPMKLWKINDKDSDNMVEHENHKHWNNPKYGEVENSDSTEKYEERPKKFQENEEAKQLHHLHQVRGNNDLDDNDEKKFVRFSEEHNHHQRANEKERFSEESHQQQREQENNRFSKEDSRERKQDENDKDNERSEKFRGKGENDKNERPSKDEKENSQYHQKQREEEKQKENEEDSQQSAFSSESEQGI